MGYVVAVKRVIGMPEVLALVHADPSLRITRQDSETLDVVWTHDGDEGFFQFVCGELQATTPSTPATHKLAALAEALGATVVGEEDLVPPATGSISPGVIAGRNTWVGWPLLVVVLAATLLWRW